MTETSDFRAAVELDAVRQRPVLVTGAAGFIGYHVAKRLQTAGYQVVGADSLNAYYDPRLKKARLANLEANQTFRFYQIDLADRASTASLFEAERPGLVVHLAAQAGVRYSIENPHAYVDSNLQGFLNILEGCRRVEVQHLLYASSSSVYGANTRAPFSTHHNVDHPISLYAATKKANELMAHSYAAIYGIPVTGVRFFTVYGPWGRPDMAMFLFTEAISEGRPINVFNHGNMQRDFTYIDDIVEGVYRVLLRPATPDPTWSGDAPDPGTSRAPARIYNIGNSSPVELTYVIELLERQLGRKAERRLLPMQPGDVPSTFADIADLERDVGFSPSTPIEVGVERFVAWWRSYRGGTAESGPNPTPRK
jgi:UDP-glucuronate 4-epimerase